MLPWTHMAIQTNGGVVPCCGMPPDRVVGSLRQSSLKSIWNSDGMRTLRRNMMEGRRTSSCQDCYEQEEHGIVSLRQSANEWFAHHLPIVAATRQDGTVDELNIRYLDVRFSNLCNLRCRYCHPIYSSRWHSEWEIALVGERAPRALLTPTDDPQELWDQLEPLLPNVEQIYFAGGEPLATPECYRLLERLIEKGLFRVRLIFNTNFSLSRLGSRDIFRLWDRFYDVQVGASLDAMGKRGEYIRSGLVWDRVVENRRRMFSDCPHAKFHIRPTMTIMNALHFPDFLENWLEQGLLGPDDVSLNMLLGPPEYRLQVLPPHIKGRVQERYERAIAGIQASYGTNTKAGETLRTIVQFMWAEDRTSELENFRARTRKLDQSRREKFEEVFPELAELMR